MPINVHNTEKQSHYKPGDVLEVPGVCSRVLIVLTRLLGAL